MEFARYVRQFMSPFIPWFIWSLETLDIFWDRTTSYNSKAITTKKTNLCSFVRTIFIWSPTVIVINLLLFFYMLASIIYVPSQLFGGAFVAKTAVGIVVIVAFMFAFIVGANIILRKTAAYREDDREEKRIRRAERKAARKAMPLSPFAAKIEKFFSIIFDGISLFFLFLLAKKANICPIIDLKEKFDNSEEKEENNNEQL